MELNIVTGTIFFPSVVLSDSLWQRNFQLLKNLSQSEIKLKVPFTKGNNDR